MNKKYILHLFTLACFTLILKISNAQYEDFQSWNNISLEKELNKKIGLVFQQDLRFKNNASMFTDYITVIGGNYSFNKYVKAQALYRYTMAQDLEDGIESEHRFYADGLFKYKIQRFRLAYRLRYQLQWEDFDRNTWHYLRNRFTVKYDIPKSSFEPFVQFELYYTLNNPIDNTINKTRYTAGLSYDVTKYLSLRGFYRVQYRRAYERMPVNAHILGIGVNFDI